MLVLIFFIYLAINLVLILELQFYVIHLTNFTIMIDLPVGYIDLKLIIIL
jgi:hypothetical protein